MEINEFEMNQPSSEVLADNFGVLVIAYSNTESRIVYHSLLLQYRLH